MITKLTPDQVKAIAEREKTPQEESWLAVEEAADRDVIVDRVKQRVATVMDVLNMTPEQLAEYVIKVEDEKAEKDEIIKVLQLDALTGLALRRRYEGSALRLLETRKKRTRDLKKLQETQGNVDVEMPQVSLLMIDADHFKQVNDTYGHAGGDFVLKELGKLINTHFRKEDLKARYGGEELIVVMPDCDLKTAREKAETFRQIVENHDFTFHPHGEEPMKIEPVRVSIGVGNIEFSEESGDAEQLKALLEKRADALVYAAKDMRRNTVVSQDGVDMEKLYAKQEADKLKKKAAGSVLQKHSNDNGDDVGATAY